MATTFAQVLGDLRRQRFVGRADELAAGQQWLDNPRGSPILAITGAGGIGKSWVLEELVSRAEQRDIPILRIDPLAGGYETPPADALVVVDAVERLGANIGALQQWLAQLEQGVRVVLSGRSPMRSGIWSSWQPLLTHLQLKPLTPGEQRQYLDRRGVDHEVVRQRIMVRSGGHPLTMSLAVDLLCQPTSQQLADSPEWRSAVRMTTEEYIARIGSRYRPALEAAAVLRQVDHDALTAVLGAAQADDAFVRLGALSGTRVVDDTIVVHDDVRRAVIEDLRLHYPRRLEAIRRAGLRYHRRRLHDGGSARSVVEDLQFVGRDLPGMSVVYENYPDLVVSAATAADIPALQSMVAGRGPVPGVPAMECDPERVATILRDPGTISSVARSGDGRILGFGWYLRVAEQNRHLLGVDDTMAAVVDATATRIGCASGLPSDSNLLYMSTIAAVDDDLPVTAALANDATVTLRRGGAFLAVPANAMYENLCQTMGFTPLPGTYVEGHDALNPYVMDLSRIGFDAWVYHLLTGGGPFPATTDADLVTAVRGAVTAETADVLASNPLASLAEPDVQASTQERAAAVRDLLDRAIDSSGAWPTFELRVRDALRTAGITALHSVRVKIEGPLPATIPAPPPSAFAQDKTGVQVRLLGGFEVRWNGVVQDVPSGTVTSLIEVVALRGSLPADELIELLWPDAGTDAGRNRLRNVLSRIRRQIAPEIVRREGAMVALGGRVRVDATHFSAQANAALQTGDPVELGAAAASYGGELLPEDRYADWCAATRERLTSLYLRLLDLLAENACDAGDYQTAVGYLEAGIDADPYEEARYLRVAELHSEAGHRSRALAVLQRAQSAAAVLDAPVGPAVRAAMTRLRSA